MRIKDLLQDRRLPRLEARMLVEQVWRRPRAWLLAHDDEPADAGLAAAYEALAQRRLAGEPMAYVIGEREFMGHVFRVTPAVLIPRPDTETLVEAALDYLRARPRARVLDLGTGSGAIAVSIALACPQAQVTATDLSAEALAVARGNAQALGARVAFAQGSWFEAIGDDCGFDLIVSNPPYIHAADGHLAEGDLRFEPRSALTDGADGLGALAEIARQAPGRLLPGGALWMEHGWDQAPAVRALLQQAGLREVASRRDLAGIERISGGFL
ncbi:peptide chain release factor N(5)-glutamine methyltransferase [Bordetella pseudohinzii]|uniref:Release factor glutamine methyltransferase n=1 Tax=Bordetella pseudohinzii TaxID=1331258 RepID=A0A0J6C751_9BORD|nr:peptide chain release factor N(5)-glutamine methyltransferase [Bordetella pseudohinzii]ANY17817.1 protein-(glutamine-N5) methyltransferase, release factor-specific [Bordetella pseudohinzii]KMM26546.1 SAM-dependent methyltransferase [Bordetella pseudohinzii]KXA77141.1 protein-(glutamine-N5) methyltransferase, release factor-specific [Bordetella pseudohinzii]KXA77457.1 protein-(glutamine-N5) methyltransferase, release factor-specific [Bordetella pseudohinzii]CUI77288.1 Release factor glutamin